MEPRQLPAASSPFPRLPEAAALLRAERARLGPEALAAAARRDPGLLERYTTSQLQTFLRDCDRHVLQLAAALDAGSVGPLAEYVRTIIPLYRRRHVPLEDLATILLGTLDACRAVLPPAGGDAAAIAIEAGLKRLERPRHLPGDRPRNPILQFFWKGAGILD
ncbi:MAG: hypothetical protein ACP5VP_05070 [Candidatus Limnocylindrales bacterium]